MGGGYGTKIVALLGIAAFVVLGAIRARHLTSVNFSDVGKAITVVALLVAAWDLLLWRWLRLPGRPPKLHGTWKMKLTRTEAPYSPTGETWLTQTCYLSVEQTANRVRPKLLFTDGESKVTSAVFAKDDKQDYILIFYDFVPKDEKSGPRRSGAASLKIGKGTLEGNYWNDKQGLGTLKSKGHVGKPSKAFEQARERTRHI